MRLKGGGSLLVLHSAASGAKEVELVASLSAVLPDWNGRDRVSPLFEIDTIQSKSPFQFKPGVAFLFFMGPVNPARAESCLRSLKGKNDRAWLSFGLFNLVVYTTSRVGYRSLLGWAEQQGVRWEKWDLHGPKVTADSHSPVTSAKPSGLLESLSRLRFHAPLPELRDAGEEYCALLAAAGCRSSEVDSQITTELEQANSIITESALNHFSSGKNGRDLPAIALLVDANAALSRFTSQMFSGMPPIQETECHFWTHSLLGTGVANLAVLKVRRFITLTLGEARIPDQISALEDVTDEALIKEVLEDGHLWNGPLLQRLPEITGRKPLLRELPPLAPLITYLSGRDGYHTTQTSLSAPLNILTSCSSLRWSLLTITHEMSHRVIDEVLSYILPDPGEPTELSKATDLLNEGRKPPNVLAALQFKILHSMATLNAAAPLIALPDVASEQDLIALMGTRREEVEEIMVHVFDFLYFYGADPEVYVPAIWRSWDAIPSLHRRLPGYVLRTLCAVYGKFWLSSTSAQDALAAVRAGMEEVAKTDRTNVYIHDAVNFLNKESEALRKQLLLRRTLVGIVRTFLQSPAIVQSVRGQSTKADRSRANYFDATPIENPLRFIESNTSAQSNATKSLWMLARLAFDTSDPDPLRVKDIHQ